MLNLLQPEFVVSIGDIIEVPESKEGQGNTRTLSLSLSCESVKPRPEIGPVGKAGHRVTGNLRLYFLWFGSAPQHSRDPFHPLTR